MLRACSEPIQIKPAFLSLNKDKGAANPFVTLLKTDMVSVRHTEVLLYPPGAKTPLRIMERPSMHVIGDHLWHSSLVMASFLLNQQLDAYLSAEAMSGAFFLELGTGCGLISLATAIAVPEASKILATDILEIVETTLAETLSANSHLSISSEALRWGEDLPSIVKQHNGDIVILASDVLYNKESHQDFLQTLLDVFAACKGQAQAFVTYKHRVIGDEGFFEMAKNGGLYLAMIHQIADVQIWHCKPK
jgi:predicted nicotinamide N-methyase